MPPAIRYVALFESVLISQYNWQFLWDRSGSPEDGKNCSDHRDILPVALEVASFKSVNRDHLPRYHVETDHESKKNQSAISGCNCIFMRGS